MRRIINNLWVLSSLMIFACMKIRPGVILTITSENYVQDTLCEKYNTKSFKNYYLINIENNSQFDTLFLTLEGSQEFKAVLPTRINETRSNGEFWYSFGCQFGENRNYSKIPKGSSQKVWFQLNGFKDTASQKEYVFSIYYDSLGQKNKRVFSINSLENTFENPFFVNLYSD